MKTFYNLKMKDYEKYVNTPYSAKDLETGDNMKECATRNADETCSIDGEPCKHPDNDCPSWEEAVKE